MVRKNSMQIFFGNISQGSSETLNDITKIELKTLKDSFKIVDNINGISKRRYLTRAEAKNFSEIASKIENEINRIVFLEFNSLSKDMHIFTSAAEDILSVMDAFAQKQNRLHHSHRLPIIDLPRLGAYQNVADAMKNKFHSIYMEADDAGKESLKAFRSEYFSLPLHNVGNMSVFSNEHLENAAHILNCKNIEEDKKLRSELKRIGKYVGDFKNISLERKGRQINGDIETLMTIYGRFFYDGNSVYSMMMSRMSSSRDAVKSLAKIKHYLHHTVKDVSKRSKTRIPARKSAMKMSKRFVDKVNSILSGNIKTIDGTIRKTKAVVDLLTALSTNDQAQEILEEPREQHRIEFSSDEEEHKIRSLFEKVRKRARSKGFSRRLQYKEKSPRDSKASVTFNGNLLILDDSSFISFYKIDKHTRVRFVYTDEGRIIIGSGTSHNDIKMEHVSDTRRDEVYGDYAEILGKFLAVFMRKSTAQGYHAGEWADEISSVLVSAAVKEKGNDPYQNMLGDIASHR